jgi:hypothetical protein
MWPFDYFKKKPEVVPEAVIVPAAHVHHGHAHPHPHVPAAPPAKTYRPKKVYHGAPYGRTKPDASHEDDSSIPAAVGGFILGELLSDSSTSPAVDSPAPDGPADSNENRSFEGFGGGQSGGAGAGGSWDAPSSDSGSSSVDTSSDSGSSSDSSGF